MTYSIKYWTTKEDNFLTNNPKMLAKKIGKKLKRTQGAVAQRRKTLGIAKAHVNPTKIGPAVIRTGTKTKTKVKAAIPITPVYTYEGNHNIATFNKLGWFTRTLLGVKAA
jgi:hypothetical protein